ncbi:MAG: DUF2333 family protein, partial [Betaproteobacteria bacterium]|nr:DUF2333 family protein [Betaproteobacteria bacterium]
MLDLKNRFARLGRSNGSSARTGSGKPIWQILGALLAIYLVAAILVGWYWSREPALFPVQQHAREAAQDSGRQLVNGYTTVETLKQVAGTLLDKPGGYLSNDIAPPGVWLDNMPAWEYGVLVQVRDLTRALRKDF